MRNFLLLTIILFILSSTNAQVSQDFDKAKLDKYFMTLEANQKFMGSVAVSKAGDIIYSKTIGFTDIENNLKANENSKYRIGSISKTFTTVLVLKAFEDKKLDINLTIDKYFPTIKNAGKITIRHLLSHRSGIHSFTSDPDYLRWNTQSKTEKQMIDIMSKAESEFEPDSKAQYSNSNFVLLTYILEKTYKKPYAEILQEQIINPVGLENTYFGGKINTANNECKSYSYSGDWKLESETDISIPLGAGGIVSTPVDLIKFGSALFSGELLKEESIALMKTIKDGYGMGLFQLPFYDKSGYGHTGGIDGFNSIFSYYADGNILYAFTSNGSNLNPNDVSLAVLSAVYNKPYDIPEFKTYDLSSDELDKYLGVYASSQMPLKITITKDNKTLIAQATGQSSFPLEATEKDKFKFSQAGIVMEFSPSEHTMLLKQGGGQYTFSKE